MKTFRRVLVFATVMCVVLLCFTSCIKTDRARGTIEAFFAAVSAEDYVTAEEYLHPDCRVNVKEFFEGLRMEEELDFSTGMEIIDHTTRTKSESVAFINNSYHITSFMARIGEKEAMVTVLIDENKGGYGISDVKIERDYFLSGDYSSLISL